ncbi:MAG: TetR/AcrR family transcriptional regulator [Marmoricola sp.]
MNDPTSVSTGRDTIASREETLHLPDDLLTVSAALFRRQGYARTTTRELANAVGIRKASLYHYIRTKEDLLYALCVQSLDVITDDVRRATRDADKPERLDAMIDAHVRSMLSNQDMHAVMLMELRALSGPRLADVIGRRDRYEAIVKDILAASQRAGLVRPEFSPGHLTLGLLNLLNWTIFWYRADGEMAPEQLASMLRTIFFQGVRTAHRE